MKTIYKYPIEIITDTFTIAIPIDAEILTIQMQYETPCIWAIVETESQPENRYFEIIGTGNPFPEESIERKYIGTFQLYGGGLVFHLFERLQ